MKQHKASQHIGLKYFCDLCKYLASQKGNLDRHRKRVHEKFKYACHRCEFRTKQKISLANHINSFHEDKKYHSLFGIRPDCNIKIELISK